MREPARYLTMENVPDLQADLAPHHTSPKIVLASKSTGACLASRSAALTLHVDEEEICVRHRHPASAALKHSTARRMHLHRLVYLVFRRVVSLCWQEPMRSSIMTAAAAGILFLIAAAACAEAPPEKVLSSPAPWSGLVQPQFDHLKTRDGLAHDFTTALVQDADQFLWIGTEAGLNRYDGHKFKTYKHIRNAAGSLPANTITVVHVDTEGRLWVGTESDGLARYDANTDQFIPYALGPSADRPAAIKSLANDGPDRIWVGTWDGLDELNPVTGWVTVYRHDPADPKTLPNNQIWSLLTDRSGTLWVGTGAGLVRRKSAETGFERVPTADPLAAEILAEPANALFQDSAGRIWLGTFSKGAAVIDPVTGTVRRAPTPPTEPNMPNIDAIAETAPDIIWLGSYGAGVEEIDMRNDRTRRLRHDARAAESLGNDYVSALLRDRSGTIWAATQTGLDRYVLATGTIGTIPGGPGWPNGISEPQVTSLAASNNGLVWVGLETEGIDVLDPLAGRVASLRPDPQNPLHALPVGEVIALAIRQDGSAWIGTNHGLYHAASNGKSVQFVPLHLPNPAPEIHTAYAVGEDVWIDAGDRVVHYRDGAGIIAEYLPGPNGSGLTDGRIAVIHPAPDGALWIGTQNGLNRLDPASGVIEQFLPDPHDPGALANGAVSGLAFDARGRLWVALTGGGIDVLVNREKAGRPEFHHLDERNGLPDAPADALLVDHSGRIWASTDSGLAVIDPATFEVRRITGADGARISIYWQQSAVVTPQNDLLFGGFGGLTLVRAEGFSAEAPPPPVVVTDATVGDRSIPIGRLNRPVPEPIELHPGDRGFTVDFAGLDLSGVIDEQYAYRLDGIDEGWVPAPQRSAVYASLPPGTYNLRLRMSGRDGRWYERSQPLVIHVSPAWHQTIWFELAAVATLIAAMTAVVNLRTASLRRRRAVLEALVKSRTKELVEVNHQLSTRTVELERANAQLEAMATTDALTGLLNRRRFMEIAAQEVERSRRLDLTFCIALCDLDHFKRVNDTSGHLAGDAVLREAAHRLHSSRRQFDTLARYGGEEFIVLMPATDLAEAAVAAERLRAIIATAPVDIGDTTLTVTISIGVASWRGGSEPFEAVVERADRALYAAKAAGRDRVGTARSEVD